MIRNGVQTSPKGDIRLVDMLEVCDWGEDIGYEGLIGLRVSARE